MLLIKVAPATGGVVGAVLVLWFCLRANVFAPTLPPIEVSVHKELEIPWFPGIVTLTAVVASPPGPPEVAVTVTVVLAQGM